ncbi:polysaccharide biosynthesis/export family protein [Helicobacter apodemus]|uniref:Sugar ABC transporter substrate-binding protein n=1 Tax=Helicobacter apodemus TaxID=135569 RepID=A0A2U8FFK7_9HELI|nr:SLBB domain-containing protein [Helicobacter apodemus]AWI34944.1 sugar ABC transporter substrate-binding protein [Helicobacter apodemus]
MKTLLKFLFIYLLLFSFGYSIDPSTISANIPQISTQAQNNTETTSAKPTDMATTDDQTLNPQNAPYFIQDSAITKVFGFHLFNGNFTQASQFLYNPDYKIAIGDKINFRMWGAVEFHQELMVDSQGNIFIPAVGAVNLLGVRNGDLVKVLKSSIAKIYKNNVFVYADMNVYQNVSIFVTGNVNKPGLYQGLSSDSIVQYLDKAGGINLEYGSFRDIEILRDNKPVLKVDLYNFLLNGKVQLFPFRTGDVILVKNLQEYVSVKGEVQKPYRFELKDDIKTLEDIAIISGAKPIVTNAIVRSYLPNNILDIISYNKNQFQNVLLKTGDEIEFRPDYNSKNISVSIEGEHDGLHSLIIKKGTTLKELIRLIKVNKQSNIEAIQVFRKSVANSQKQLIESQLKELETLALTSSSITTQESAVRSSQANMILEFIQRAKNIQPKGQIVLDSQEAYATTILEEGDIINIPTKNNLVLVQGEVAIPGAFIYEPNKNLQYYIKLAGDFTERANKKRILLIRANGKAERYNGSWYALSSAPGLNPGDSLLILPAIETGRNLQITSILTQILYQIAIATKVVLDINK